MHAVLWPLMFALFTVPVMIWQWRRARREAIERLREEFQRRIAQRVLEQLSGRPQPDTEGSKGVAQKK
ncbi:MAG: hypothetical protein ACRESS_01490 [Stenotrophobium sp.]